MKLPMHLPQLFIGDMRIDLCCRDILMSEKLLNRAKVSTVSEQGSREGMPNRMCRNRLYNTSFQGSSCDHLGDKESVESYIFI